MRSIHSKETDGKARAEKTKGTLYVIATPIGNLDDISVRALKVISEVAVLACEDTRVTRKILSRYDIRCPDKLLAHHEHNEKHSAAGLVDILLAGEDIGLCSNAGMPGLSDPGYRAISSAIDHEIPVEVIPGANAAITALVVSGLPTSSYVVLGFPPRKSAARCRWFRHEAQHAHTMIFHESPFRIAASLIDACKELGDRRCAVANDLTKIHQNIRRGWLSELAAYYEENEIKGEITAVISGNNPKFCRKAHG